MINPMKLDPNLDNYGYRYYAGVLGAFVALSVAGNMAYYMVETIPTPVVAVSHGMPPVIFALMVHMGPTLRSSFAGSVRRPGPRARRERGHIDWASFTLLTVLGLAVATVAIIALIVSFSGLEGLAAAMGWGRWSWTLPVLIDVPAGAATIGVMAAASAMKADAAVVDEVTSSTDEIVTQLVTGVELGDELPAETVSSAGQGRSVVGNSTVRRVTDEFEDAGDELPDELVTSGDELGVEVITNSSLASRHPSELGVRTDELLDTTDELAAETVDTAGRKWSVDGNSSPNSTDRRVTDEFDEFDEQSDELGRGTVEFGDDLDDTDELLRERARELVATTKINASADELATVLALDGRGESKRAIADRIGRSRSTVTGWLKAAEAAERLAREGQRRPALAVVND